MNESPFTLLPRRPSCSDLPVHDDTIKVFEFAEEYRKFISACKTERECVRTFVERAEAAGYLDIILFCKFKNFLLLFFTVMIPCYFSFHMNESPFTLSRIS